MSAEPLPLVLDWDGTVTVEDTLHQAIEAFGDLEVFRRLEAEIGRRLTLNEVIAVEMATIRTPLANVVTYLLEAVRVRPGFHELAAAHDPLVVSAGFHELIEPVLEREGVRLRVVANRLADGPDGLVAVFRDGPRCDVCGEECKRSAAAGLDAFAFAGDGVSDRCIALAADRLFARAGLARWLRRRGRPFEPFDDLHDVAHALARAPSEVHYPLPPGEPEGSRA